MKFISKSFKFWFLTSFCYLLSILCAWAYGNSYELYASLSIALISLAFLVFLNTSRKLGNVRNWVLFVLFTTLLIGLINGDLKSAIMVNTSLLLPFAIAAIEIDYKRLHKQVIIASLLNLLLVIFASEYIGGTWNSNALAIMIYCGISTAFIWYKVSTSRFSALCSVAFLIFSSSFLFLTGCRNAGIVIIACGALVIFPSRFMKNKLIFRTIYLGAILATVFAEYLMNTVLHDDQMMNQLTNYTEQFSEKAWGMGTHYDILLYVKDKFASLDLFTQLLGSGIKSYHCHNLFYQCLFFYGLVGTCIIYGIYIYIFELGYSIFVKHNDILALTCSIILIGHFMMQIGEVYMLGAETTNLMALLPAGIIIQRKLYYNENSRRNALLQA